MLVVFHSLKRKIKDNAKFRKLLNTFGTPERYTVERSSIRVFYSYLHADFIHTVNTEGGRVKLGSVNCRATIVNSDSGPKQTYKTPKPNHRCTDKRRNTDVDFQYGDFYNNNSLDLWFWNPSVGMMEWNDVWRHHSYRFYWGCFQAISYTPLKQNI